MSKTNLGERLQQSVMETQENGPDDSSIRPVSSLLSKFENLKKDPDAPKTPVAGQRQASLGNRVVSEGRPQSAGRLSASPTVPRPIEAPTLSVPRARRMTPPRQRPVSMAAGTPPLPFPPLVTVDSPKSPPVDYSVENRLASTMRNVSPSTRSVNAVHSRNASRSATPAMEQRMSAFLVNAEPVKSTPTGNSEAPFSLNRHSTTQKSNGPPPVNRAGKPKIPVKPAALSQPSQGLTAPEPNPIELTDHSASPFSTPPSSAASSPAKTPLGHARARSDASFVERLRGDSDASSMAERVRSGSTNSNIEPLSLPESHFEMPPLRQVAPPARDNRNGLSRAPTMPARYSPFSKRETTPTGDLETDRPRLPARPELQIRSDRISPNRLRSGRNSPPKARSGRTSPSKLSQSITTRRSMDLLHRTTSLREEPQPRIPAVKPALNNTLSQSFERPMPKPVTVAKALAPEVPPPRRSMDKRPQIAPVVQKAGHSHDDVEDVPPASATPGQGSTPNDFPDSSTASRRPPRYRQRPHQIFTEYDTRLVAACGEYVCTTGYITKVWNIRTGERVLLMAHSEGMKITSLVFKPSSTVEEEGTKIWLGTSTGDIHEIDIIGQSILKSKSAHRRSVIKMFRYASELWSLDESGELVIWKKSSSGMPSLDQQTNSFRVPKGHTFSIACGEQLWIATGKDIRVFRPSARSDEEFQVLRSPLTQLNTGDVSSGATISSQPDFVYFGHTDGKISIYNRRDFSCAGVVNVSVYKISSLAGVGDYLWAGYNTGMAYVYDTSSTPWKVKKDWHAHEKQICSIVADPSSVWHLDRLQVITLGTDNTLRIWDGMLEEDWLDTRMHDRDSEFCSFRELSIAVMTWNAGAVKPSLVHSQYMSQDNNFLRDYMTAQRSPDFLVFGFQELVDLENKKVTAKSFFKSKRKDPAEQEHMSHQYRAWRDYLTRCMEDFMPADTPYVLLSTSSMVGLFTCIFVKSSLRSRIKHVHTSEVKRGMGGLHGNKGALVLRMVLDDSSLCFMNCHLAAGQTQTIHRNNDIAAILEAEPFPANPLSHDSAVSHADIFASGGDGSMIMDHEICILNGDLNYRIDTMGRDTVIKHVRDRNLPRLLERDQLLLSRKKNPGFRLRAFAEAPITFDPTYKYNVNTDDYDTSEKKRAPAWCDRVLFRGLGKVKCEEYRRWEVRVSDHRPVSALLKVRIKRVDAKKRVPAWEKCLAEFEGTRTRVKRSVQLDYLTNVLGMLPKDAAAALRG